MQPLRITVRSLAVVLLVVMGLPLGWTVVTGDFFMTVTGRSMSPTYEIGDVLLVRQPVGDELDQVGAIVVVKFNDDPDDAAQYVHRVVEPTADGAWLQGDNNETRDPRPVRPEAVLGTPRLAMTGPVATAFDLSQNPVGRVVLAAAALTLLLVPVRRSAATPPGATPPTAPAPAPATEDPTADASRGEPALTTGR
ncbi:S26 family signal peptidase [Cellulomonas sp. IC4_254]|uniref:S26 family signal peptidase n=1 Tax=Cellulomonas sp. IC4_254 TaxID=2714040 RepID=UPI00141E61D2|nr:S26 family signal peptidase [Cellulomonas sp. IC4_254]NHT17275.1 S26 family signal peptidase [Cellulomonas sp. IC4_254]